MPMQGVFNANQYEPNQGGQAHPAGKFQSQIANTQIVPNKSGDGGMFRVTHVTPSGQIDDNYNLWFNNPDDGQKKAIEIAHKQLSALCHATGVFKLNWQDDGAAIRGAKCMIEVGPQLDRKTKEPTGYVEIKKVYDINGNEPGKVPSPAPNAAWQPAPGAQMAPPPATQAQPQPNPPAQGGWGAPQQPPAQAAPNPSAPPWAQNR